MMRFPHFMALFCVLSAACGKKPTVEEKSIAPASIAVEKGAYLDRTRAGLDAYSFVSPPDGHCDSLLFTSLYLAAGGSGVDLLKARDGNGLWERHPARDCSSTISKDMYTGLIAYLWHARDLGATSDLIHAGEVHNWVMGNGPAGNVVMTPSMVATLYELRYRLGGPDGLGRQLYDDRFEGDGLTGFDAHLQVVGILNRGAILGGKVTTRQMDILRTQAERQPQNVLFQAAFHRYLDGNQQVATALWPVYCPAGRLPTTGDRCNDYLWQRDESPKDWGPCPKTPPVTFTGVDCEVAAAVIDGTL